MAAQHIIVIYFCNIHVIYFLIYTVSQKNRTPDTYSNNTNKPAHSSFNINKFWQKESSRNQHLIARVTL